jgi:hypothetical protein
MADQVADNLFDGTIDILPPEEPPDEPEARACLCCRRKGRPMDEDGCGICDECLGL